MTGQSTDQRQGGGRLNLAVAGVLVDRDGRVLLATRPQGRAYAGFWEFPGGKIEKGETPEQALQRELKEELGIETDLRAFLPFSFVSRREPNRQQAGGEITGETAGHLLMPVFLCRRWSGVVSAREGQSLAWSRPAEILNKYKILPANTMLVAQLADGWPA